MRRWLSKPAAMVLDLYGSLEGTRLLRFVDSVRAEYLERPMYEELRLGLRQVNSVRVVTIECFERLPLGERLALVEDLLFRNDGLRLLRSADAVFAAADSPGAHVVDLVCEVVWQTLMRENAIRIEEEIRSILAAVA